MSTVVASYTPVCRSPVLPASAGMWPASRSWKPAAALPASVAVKCRRPLSVTCALPEKQRPAFSIPPTALLYPIPPSDANERWDIKEEDGHVKLLFQVPGLTEDDLAITVSEDLLEIKRKEREGGAPADVHGVGPFRVRLLITKEYDHNPNNVEANLEAGMLEVTVRKFVDSEQYKREPVKFRSKGQREAAERTPTAPNKSASGAGSGQPAPARSGR